MQCPNCRFDNPENAKFCSECGTKLLVVCPQCGTQNLPASKFCSECGSRLAGSTEAAPQVVRPAAAVAQLAGPQGRLQSFMSPDFAARLRAARTAGAMSGERRVVTILFCDVKGSTGAAEQLDPEEWAEIMSGVFEHMIRPVYQYEGTVARLMGDAIVAIFGAPIAHEDDPQRAILAGLEIVEAIAPFKAQVAQEWGIDISLRVGINTGLVMVGQVGSDLQMEYTALGDAVNVAARMEQTAEPGSVQVSEYTYSAVAPLFEWQDLGEVQVKGKEEAIHTYRPLRPEAQPGRLRGIEGLESPLVGRDKELHDLREAVRNLRQGRGGIVSIMGEAGLGKSRLVDDLRQEVILTSGDLGAWQWLAGRCLSYQSTTPYAPFADMLVAHFGLSDEQSNEEKYYEIARQVSARTGGQSDALAPYIATLLAIPLSGAPLERVKFMEPPQLRGRVFSALQDYLDRMAQKNPVVMVIDDLHWADPSSLELLASLLPLTERAAVLLVALFRPFRQDPGWRFHEIASRDFAHRYQVVNLHPLDPDSARQLVANLLYVEDLPHSVRSLILAKAEGNPFFVEEVIRSLLDAELIVRVNGHWQATRAIKDISVPDTLASLIHARLDRLDDEAKQAAQSAAVLGREFSYRTLEAITQSSRFLEESLAELKRRELIHEKSRLPERVYQFKHALTQEAAYESLLLRTRRELHLRAAGYLKRAAPEHVNDIAYHYLNARRPKEALPFLLEAGDRAAKAYAGDEAIGFYRQALDILQTIDDLALARRAYEGLGEVQTFLSQSQDALETYQSMLALAQKRGDVPMQVSALNKIALVTALHMGQFETAEQYLADSDRLARESGDKPGLSEMGLIRCMMCTAVADFEGVVRYMDETVTLAKELNVKEQMAMGLTHIAGSQALMLQFDRARKTLEEGLKLSRQIGDRMHEAELLGHVGAMCHIFQGDLDTARRMAKDGLEIADEIGHLLAVILSLSWLGHLALEQGEYEQAITTFQRMLDLSHDTQKIWLEAQASCKLGTTYLHISPALLERVLDFHQKAAQMMEIPGGAMMGATDWADMGYCFLSVGKLDEAAQAFEKGLTIPSISGHLEHPRLLVGMGLTSLARGAYEESNAHISEAMSYVEEHGLISLAPWIDCAAGHLAETRNNHGRALAAFTRAEEKARQMNLRPLVWQSCAGIARAMDALGAQEKAREKRAQAIKMVDEITGLFEDSEYRRLFAENARAMIESGTILRA